NPKVKARGGEPMKMSSFEGLRQERGKQSHIAITSRWKCMVPLGLPVVPEVKAISATSSDEVSTFLNSMDCFPISASVSSSYQYLMDLRKGQEGKANFNSASNRLSQSAWVISA